MKEIEDVLSFWFGDIKNSLCDKPHNQLWYQGSEKFDNEIAKKFSSLVKMAASGQLNAWQGNAKGSLALVILLDQLPRNIFRGTEKAFSFDSLALSVCKSGIAQGFDKELSLIEQVFYYHPFQHSELLVEQERSVALFSVLLTEFQQVEHLAVIENALHWTREHLAIIKQFGRFPHRNKVLARDSRPEEIDYLKSGHDFGQKENKTSPNN